MTDPRITVDIKAALPRHLIAAFLQHVRNFDTLHHDEAHFGIWIEAPDMPLDEAQAIFRSIDPPFPQMISFREPESSAQRHDAAEEDRITEEDRRS